MKNLGLRILLLFSIIGGPVSAQKQPKNIVGIVVDQMCYDYLYRYQQHFCSGGFNRFLNKGLNCRNTLYNYVPTYTGPGHASIYTGTTPSNHGIVGNEWYQRETKTIVNCVTDKTVQTVGSTSSEGQTSPRNLRTYTVTDQLKLASPESKVISISIKDRSSILPGGHLSDGSYWYDYASGTFITSTYFKSELPKWLQQFNATKNADKYLKNWDLLYPKTNYKSVDESPYEVVLSGKKSATFPYDFKEMSTVSKNAYQLFTISPFANELLTDLAIEAISREQLGLDNKTDMLCISYSTPDIAGHAFGPYSLEMEDMYARLDRQLEKLLSHLESNYGKDGFVVFLTADHAVQHIPAYAKKHHLPGGLINESAIKKELNELFIKNSLDPKMISDIGEYYIHFNHELMDSLHVSQDKLVQLVTSSLEKNPGILQVVETRKAAIAAIPEALRERIVNGYSSQRSGDLFIVTKSGYMDGYATGTTHGTLYNNDAHIPLLWYGNGIKKGQINSVNYMTDIAPTISTLLDIQMPSGSIGKPILEVLGSKY